MLASRLSTVVPSQPNHVNWTRTYLLPCHRPTRTRMILPCFSNAWQIDPRFRNPSVLFAKIGISRRPRFSWGYSNAQTVQALCLAFLVALGKLEGIEHLNSIFAGEEIAILTVSSFFSLAEAVKEISDCCLNLLQFSDVFPSKLDALGLWKLSTVINPHFWTPRHGSWSNW